MGLRDLAKGGEMVFERLQGLGPEKFQRIVNDLVRGVSPTLVARLIQAEWGDFAGVAEDTLAKQLKRLSKAVSDGLLGGPLADQMKQRASVGITLLKGSSLNVLDSLTELAGIQRERVLSFVEKEKDWPGLVLGKSTLITDYRDTLLSIQKVKFDLGVDEFKRDIPRNITILGTTQEEDRQLVQATAAVEEIFRMRGIYGRSADSEKV